MIKYIKESAGELKNNVTWTKRADVQKMVLNVTLFSVILSLIIWGMDTVLIELISIYTNITN